MRVGNLIPLAIAMSLASACGSPTSVSPPSMAAPTWVAPTVEPTPIAAPTCDKLTVEAALRYDLDMLRTPTELLAAVKAREPEVRGPELDARGEPSLGWTTIEGIDFAAWFVEQSGLRSIDNHSVGKRLVSSLGDAVRCFGEPDYYLATDGRMRLGNRIPMVDEVHLYYIRLGLIVEGWQEAESPRDVARIRITALNRTPTGTIQAVWRSWAKDASETYAAAFIREAVRPWPGVANVAKLEFIDRLQLDERMQNVK